MILNAITTSVASFRDAFHSNQTTSLTTYINTLKTLHLNDVPATILVPTTLLTATILLVFLFQITFTSTSTKPTSNEKNAPTPPPGIRNPLRLIPSPPAWPIIGHTLQVFREGKDDFFSFMTRMARFNPQYHRLFLLKFFGREIVWVGSWDLAKEVLVKGQANYSARGWTVQRAKEYRDPHIFIYDGENIGNTVGPSWRWRRQIMSTLFTPKYLAPHLFPYVVSRVSDLTSEILSACKQSTASNPHAPPQTTIDVDQRLMQLTVEAVTFHLLGKDCRDLNWSDIIEGMRAKGSTKNNAGPEDLVPYFWTLAEYFDDVLRLIPGIRNTKFAQQRFLDARKRLHDFMTKAVHDIINEESSSSTTKKTAESTSNAKYPTAPWAFAREFAQLPEVKAEPDTLIRDMLGLLFAGHDSTSHSMAFALHGVATNPHVEEMVLEEAVRFLGPVGAPLDKLEYADLAKLEYTSAVLRETLRLYPIGVVSIVETTAPITLDSYYIPPNTTMAVDARSVQYDPAYYTDPDKFLPERWYTKGAGVDTSSIGGPESGGGGSASLPEMGFSLGAHACFGRHLAMLEARIVIAALVRDFHIRPVYGEKMKPTVK
ncbi:hypothetical protein HK102_006664, partial [Quaeritorhiza haematococci]